MALCLLFLALATGCRCREQAPVPDAPPMLHYSGWGALADAVARGDRVAAAQLAIDMTGGEPAQWSGPGADRAVYTVGSGLAFIAMAEDSAELADGVAGAAVGCGRCHEAAAIRPLEDRPAWAHATAADWALWGLVWNERTAPPEAGDAVAQELARRWKEPVAIDTGPGADEERDRAARLLAGCAECHHQP